MGTHRRGYRISVAVPLGWEILVTLLLISLPFPVLLFLSEPPVILIRCHLFAHLAATQVFMALEGLFRVFRGWGDAAA